MYQQPLHTDKLTPGEKDDRKARFPTGTIDLFLISCPLRSEFSHFHSRKSCDTQEELVAYLERIQDVIKDNLSDGELIDDPAEVVLDMLTVSLDWMLITVSPTWSHQRSLDTLITRSYFSKSGRGFHDDGPVIFAVTRFHSVWECKNT
jgi:hypothetical protein